ncbi:MAG: hypothetical protein KDJ99_12175 [Candidatus Competibacteraceae bacterium]|nr:hypothetical protein [Candidatus Competibacteraceae bacterium]
MKLHAARRALTFSMSLALVFWSFFGIAAQAQTDDIVETDTQVYPGEPLSESLSKTRASASYQLKSAESERSTLSIELAAPSDEDLQAVKAGQGFGKPTQIGFGRTLPPPYDQPLDMTQLDWMPLADGGQAAVLTVRSPDAAAIRLLVDLGDLPAGVELRFFRPAATDAAAAGEISAPITQLQAQQAAQNLSVDDVSDLQVRAPLWSPVIAGDSIGLEIYLPAQVAPADVAIRLPLLSHLLLAEVQSDLKSLAQLGDSGSCEIDVACDNSDIPDALIDSVAKIRFSGLTGGTFLCSGTLLNDTDDSSFIPYFYTAHHCISDQFSASSMDLFWFFQRTSCGGPDPTSVVQQSSGATLLVTGSHADYTLLRLNSAPPAGVGFSGWSTASLHTQTGLVGLHHPSGDIKKISRGDGQGTTLIYDPNEDLGDPDDPNFIEITWFSGVTEGGSSGSGLWARSNGQLRLIGTLTGGFSFCAAPNSPDYYGRFDVAYPALADFLVPDSGQPVEQGRLKNISTNLEVDKSGASAGFIVTGTEPQRFVLMGEDAGSLQDPQLELINMTTGERLAFNDDWETHATASEVVSRDREPNSPLAAAFAVTLSQGIYLATLSGVEETTGRGLVSVTQVDDSTTTHLLNISTNGFVDRDGAVAGFIVSGKDSRRYVIMGEGLESLADPVIEVTSLDRRQIFGSNDNWRDHATADEVLSKDRAPRSTQDAALAITLQPGVYLAILQGKNGATGRGLISVTEVGD